MAFLDIKNALLALNAQLKKLNKKFEIVEGQQRMMDLKID
jgi:hypothetical protein